MTKFARQALTALALLMALVPALAQETPSPAAITASNARRIQFSTEIPQPDVVNDIAFSPDGTLLLTAGQDTAVRVWSIPDGEMVAESYEHFSFVKGAAFTGDAIATGSWDHSLILWDMADGALTPRATFSGYTGVIEHISVSPDGSRIAFGVGDGRVRIADSTTGEVIHELPVGALRVTAVVYSPDGARVATAGGFPATGAAVWDATNGNPVFVLTHSGTVTALAYSPDGTILAAGGDDGTVSLWQDGARIGLLPVDEWVTDIAFSPDGMVLVAARQDGVIALWNISDPAAPDLIVGAIAADAPVTSVAFSPDGTLFATAGEDRSVRLWRVE